MGEVRLQLGWPMVRLPRALWGGHIQMCADNFDKFPARGRHRVAGCLKIFKCSIWKYNPELNCVVSTVPPCVQNLVIHPTSVIRMDPLLQGFVVRKTLIWVKPPNSVIFFRPILKRRQRPLWGIQAVNRKPLARRVFKKIRRVKCPTSHMTKALPLAEVKLAALDRLLGALAFCHIDDRTDNLHKFFAFGELWMGIHFDMFGVSSG